MDYEKLIDEETWAFIRETGRHYPEDSVGLTIDEQREVYNKMAAAFRKPTDALMEQWKDRPMFPMSLTEVIPGGVTLNAGGYPIFDGAKCIGAIGIGGGSPSNDGDVARLTVEAIGGLPKG